ncbi:hypothetical protein [Herminiimonas contaminans]|uniref:Uncharacterized protein n=1 Tax=Herminiimonas contaminans TaxID=1111140 RepID=A0ABS0EX00_9BURK|nr:hypothetical protein [Herminiimonas contaminans]MBF8177673.1 hypothetical protein [Herminiimonas contaminans]
MNDEYQENLMQKWLSQMTEEQQAEFLHRVKMVLDREKKHPQDVLTQTFHH